MKVISVVLLSIAATASEAFAPSGPAFTRSISDTVANTSIQINPNMPALANTATPFTSTSLRMAFESPEEVELDMEERMEKSIDTVKKNLITIRTGRASASILDLIKVDYYGASTPLNQVASVSVANSQQLSVSPYDKSSLGDIERAIVESNLGLTPNNDGDLIRINIPAITEDRRKELMKNCKSLGEDGKVAIRNIRRDGVEVVKKMEKASDIGEDESKGAQDKIQKLTDQYVKEIDTLIAAKEKDVMTV